MIIRSIILLLVGVALQATALADCIPINESTLTIVSPGEYCLTKNISTWNGVRINAANVVLDLKGYSVSYQPLDPANPAAVFGIYSAYDNVTVRNGSVLGFYIGVDLTSRTPGGGGYVVENLLVGSSRNGGISIHGGTTSVRNNVVTNTIGSNVRGIEVWGNYGRVTIDSNRVVNTRALPSVNPNDPNDPMNATAQAFGIFVRNTVSSFIRNNFIIDLTPGSGGKAVGIDYWSDASFVGQLALIGYNVIENPVIFSSIPNSTAIFVNTYPGTGFVNTSASDINKFESGIVYANDAAGPVRGNTVRNATTPYFGGTQSGNK